MPARGGGRFVSKGSGPDWLGKIVEFLKKISP
jgi:hypothetical protein